VKGEKSGLNLHWFRESFPVLGLRDQVDALIVVTHFIGFACRPGWYCSSSLGTRVERRRSNRRGQSRVTRVY
jgi:hypothetical protein